MQIALVYNAKNPDNALFSAELAAYITAQGGQLLHPACPGITLEQLDSYNFSSCDTVIALGGDGTMLATARHLAPLGVACYGINRGRLGFLSAVEKDGAHDSIDRLMAGEYVIQDRLMLAAYLCQGDERRFVCSALNEIVVNGGASFRSISLELIIDDERISSYDTDGIIVSTPTGSTGYSFSANGPILMEELEGMVITPLCPHTFFSRPIVCPADCRVDIVNLSTTNEASLTADGQVLSQIGCGGRVDISRFEYPARLIRFNAGSLFERIKTKLYI